MSAKRRSTAIGWQEAEKIEEKLRAAMMLGRVSKEAQDRIAEEHKVSRTWLQQFAGKRRVACEK